MSEHDGSPGVHFVGTVPLSDEEEVFRVLTEFVGDRIKRMPDGETGARKDWVWTQVPIMERHPDLVNEPIEVPGLGTFPRMTFRQGYSAESVDLGNVGYADEALKSYETFARLKRAGVIDERVRFQVDIPTPVNIVGAFVQPDAVAAVERSYQQAIAQDLERILTEIPHRELAVQWDTCLEVLMIEGSPLAPPWFDDVWTGITQRIQWLDGLIPDDVQLGHHLCYGDFQHRRSVDPEDASNLVAMANIVIGETPRRIDFLQIPVRDDVDLDHYLSPLSSLSLEPETDVYLGVITDSGNSDAVRERMRVASKYLDRFGVSTECGLGRRPREAVRPLLEIHRDVTTSIAA